MNLKSKEPRKISMGLAAVVLILIFLIVGVPSTLYNLPMEPLFFASWLIIIPVCMKLGYGYDEIEKSACAYCQRALGPMFVMFACGAMMGVWISSGTVPTIMYYGLRMISPKIFLAFAFLLCSTLSFITGTSWGTIGTAGIAMSSIGMSLGITPGMIAGAVISGAVFGDGISMMSSSNNLAASACEVPLMEHFKSVSKYALILFLIVFLVYLLIGFGFSTENFDVSQVDDVTNLISDKFKISIISLIPLVVLVTLLVMKKPAFFSIMISVVVGGIVAFFYQGYAVDEIINIAWRGYVSESGSVFLDNLLNRGGITSMFRLMSTFIFTFGLIGMLNLAGVIDTVLEPLHKRVNTEFKLIFLTVITGIIFNIIAGSMNVAIVMTATSMLPLYKKLNVSNLKLSSIVSMVCIFGSVLVPWNANGIFAVSVLNVQTYQYMPYTFLSLIAPVFIILISSIKKLR